MSEFPIHLDGVAMMVDLRNRSTEGCPTRYVVWVRWVKLPLLLHAEGELVCMNETRHATSRARQESVTANNHAGV